MIKKILFLLVCITCVHFSYAQEEEVVSNASSVLASDIPLHNSLKYNRFFFNPTFSLVRENRNSINIYNRNPRATFSDNSQTYFLNYSAKFEDKTGIGIGLFQQNVYAYRFFGATANYAYNLELDRDMNFTFGLNLQYSQSSLKTNLTDEQRAEDIAINNFVKSSVFILHPGVNFNYGNFDVGASVGNLVAYNLTDSQLLTDNFVFAGHLMYTTEFDLGFDNEIRAMAYGSKPGQNALRYGANVLFELPQYGWAQLGYNSFFGAAIGIGANINKMVSVGYTIEPGIGGENNEAEFGATHELGLAFNFEQVGRKKKRRASSSNKAYEARDSELRRLKKEILQQNKLIRTLKGSSGGGGDTLSQAQRSMSKLQRSIEEAKEKEQQRARRSALQREENVKLLNKKEEDRLAGSKTLQREMSEQKREEERLAASKTLQLEMSEQKREEQRLAASKKSLQLEMSEQKSQEQEEEEIAAAEAEREAEAEKQESALEAIEEAKRKEQIAIAAKEEEARLVEQKKIEVALAEKKAAEEKVIQEAAAEAERLASRKKLEREVAEKKAAEEKVIQEAAAEAQRIASRKKLEREVAEKKAAEEKVIQEAAAEQARQEQARQEQARQEAAAQQAAAAEKARQEAAAEQARQEAAAQQAAAAEKARQEAAAEQARQEAAAAEKARQEAANNEPEEDITDIQKEIDNSSRITKKLIASRDSLLNTASNLDKREFSKLLESLVNMGDQAEEVKNESDPTSSKKLKAKNRFIKFAEATRPEARYATKFIPGYPEGYYLIGNVFKGGTYADKFTGKLKDLGFNDAQIILNPENQFQYVSIASYASKEEASENYFNNIGNKYFGNIWILKIAKSRVESMKRLVQESKIIKNTVQDDTVLTESLSYIGGHNIKTGYYLITNIFKRENYFERGMANLKAKGLEPKFFRNPKDNYIYVYLERYDDLDNAKQSLFSNVNNKYDGELYILKIQ